MAKIIWDGIDWTFYRGELSRPENYIEQWVSDSRCEQKSNPYLISINYSSLLLFANDVRLYVDPDRVKQLLQFNLVVTFLEDRVICS